MLILLFHFLLKIGTSSQFEDSNLLIWGKSSLNHTFIHFLYAIIQTFLWTSIMCMLRISLSFTTVISLQSLLSFYFFWFCFFFHGLGLLFSAVSLPIPSSATPNFVFILCDFLKFFNLLLSWVLQLLSHLPMPCHLHELILSRQLFLYSYFIKAIVSLFYSRDNVHNFSHASWQQFLSLR